MSTARRKRRCPMKMKLVSSGGNWLGNSLQQIKCPVFISDSLKDQALVRPAQYALEMLTQLQDGRAFISQQGGHPLMWSAPEAFRQAVSGFLERFEEFEI